MPTSVSVITPTHRISSFISELYDSLLEQTYSQWEWVIYLNGEAIRSELPSSFLLDDRIRIFEDDGDNSSIGRIKRAAFSAASGEILVEVDHDDILMPNCLARLVEAFEDEGISFVYSDCAYLQTNKPFVPHNPSYGWTHKKIEFREKILTSMNSFPASSHSLSYIWWAPNHVRSWRASDYFRIGGHSEDFEVCDDHELLIRTFLFGTMKFIDEVLYVYRIDGSNTVYSKNALIQETTKSLNLEFAKQLALRESGIREKFSFKVCLPGMNTISSKFPLYFLNVNSPDFQLKLEDSSVFALDLSEVVHAFSRPADILTEAYRVLDHGGWLFLDTPAIESIEFYSQTSFCSFWNQNLIKMLTEGKYRYLTPDYKSVFITNRLEEYRDERGKKRVRAFLNAVKDKKPRFPGKIA